MAYGAARSNRPRRILHVGCGGDALPPWLRGDETRLDIDPGTQPNIIASMTDMGEIGTYDVVYCSHALEHLYPHEIGVALGEFLRVLESGGTAVVIVPDLEGIEPTDEILMRSPGGDVAGVDLYYGLRSAIKERPYMAHHTGFVSKTLRSALECAGFVDVITERAACYNLMGIGNKP